MSLDTREELCVTACEGFTDEELADFCAGGIKEILTDLDEVLVDVERELNDVPYCGSLVDGIKYLKCHIEDLESRVGVLTNA